MSCFGTQIKHWFAVFHSCLLLVWTLEVGLDIGQGQSTWTSALVVKDVAHEKRSSSYVLKNTQKNITSNAARKREISVKRYTDLPFIVNIIQYCFLLVIVWWEQKLFFQFSEHAQSDEEREAMQRKWQALISWRIEETFIRLSVQNSCRHC